jgi:fucose 4-O-acetylase-like acetyltransferase
MRKNYLTNITVLQFMGILLVIIGHCGGQSIPQWFQIVVKYIYSFHMQLFFSISGFLWLENESRTGQYDIQAVIKKKVNRLLLPYVSISTIAFPIKAILSNLAYRSVNINLTSYINNIIFPWNNVIIFFWFLPTLFLIFFIATLFLLNKNPSIKYLFMIFVLSIIVSILVKNINIHSIYNIFGIISALRYFPYFILGMVLLKYDRYFDDKKVSYKIIFSCSMYIAMAVLQIGIKSIDLSMIIAFMGIFASFNIASCFKGKNIHFFVALIGKYSYQIYLLSWFPQILIRIICFDRNIFEVPFTLAVFISIIFTLSLSIIATLLINEKFKVINKFIGL